LELPLTGSVQVEALAADGGATPEPADTPEETKASIHIPFEKWYFVVIPIVAIPLLLVLWRQVQIKKRRARRMKRMARVIQMRNSRLRSRE
jgi:hypothetical protein